MNIESFLITLLLGCVAGGFIGYFVRDVFAALAALIYRVYAKPRYFRPFDPENIIKNVDATSSNEPS